ncbi:MAG TPA: hypothetical protein VIU41_03215 [Geobacteraceae bacterium]
MILSRLTLVVLCLAFLPTSRSLGADAGTPQDEGTLVTIWPLVDYRESPAEGFSNLAILGPLFKWQQSRDTSEYAVRPLFSRSTDTKNDSSTSDYLYPLASSETTPEVSRFQFLKLYQKNTLRKDEEADREQDSMFFPFYISGTSKKYGPYTSVFPFYGDIYERFWRDEYHYVLFPIYGRTVKNGTTNTNVLYPLFGTTSGEQESGFKFWPLYGQSSKTGVYRKRFVLWPIYTSEESGLDTANPVDKLFLFPLYAATDSPDLSSRTYLWPFFGHTVDRAHSSEEWDLLWPFWLIASGKERNVSRFLPFYSKEEYKGDSKHWYLWPIFKQETMISPSFRQEKSRVLYFLFTDNQEEWPTDGASRRRTAAWPLFVYNRDTRGVKSFSFPAPVEPILDKPGIEKNWAPLWRIYQQRWNDQGDSAASLLWNLYWHEQRGDSLAYELFPLVRYRSLPRLTEFQFLKGLVTYRQAAGQSSLRFFWLPGGFTWQSPATTQAAANRLADGGAQ